ncbi:protease inhibitor I42 family protein [Actinophytocola sp.]|uniref:protease inhibitor I42 family protein n=1 Tax=Actinophytocola sp. TaxID=1872138 RepID=UPI003D6AFD06
MRQLVVAAVAVALLASGCVDERPGSPRADADGPTEFTIEDTSIEVGPGETFTIAVGDNASVGDDWSLREKPDADVVAIDGDYYVADPGEANTDGGGGTHYFRFTAKAAGTTSVELLNCFRGCRDPEDERRYRIDIEVR